eukprot:g3538.t1
MSSRGNNKIITINVVPIILDMMFTINCVGFTLMIVYQVVIGTSNVDLAIVKDEDETEDDSSSEEEWQETFNGDTKIAKMKMERKLKQLHQLEEAKKKEMNQQQLSAIHRLADRVPQNIKKPKLKRSNSGHNKAPAILVSWFESIRVGLSSSICDQLKSLGVSHVHDFLHIDAEALDSLKSLMKKTEKKRFQRGVDSITRKKSQGASVLTSQVDAIKSLEALIVSAEEKGDNADNIKLLKERRNQMKTKLKAKVDLALKIKELENKIKTILEELAEEGVSEVEQKSLKATLKTLKETLAQSAAEMEKLE